MTNTNPNVFRRDAHALKELFIRSKSGINVEANYITCKSHAVMV
jgi:hypothetical protein